MNSTLYIPTTEEVRDEYSFHCEGYCERCGKSDDVSYSFHESEFDRWLTEVKAQERERIRANIIDRVQDLSSCHKNDNCQELGALIASYIEEWIDDTE